jgi:hypothetical protein
MRLSLAQKSSSKQSIGIVVPPWPGPRIAAQKLNSDKAESARVYHLVITIEQQQYPDIICGNN